MDLSIISSITLETTFCGSPPVICVNFDIIFVGISAMINELCRSTFSAVIFNVCKAIENTIV